MVLCKRKLMAKLPDSAPLNRKTILVIDDDAAFLINLNQVLSDGGYHVLEATNVGEGMAVLERLHTQIDLAFVDLVLPGGSGFEVINAISRRANPMKIVAITGLLKPNYLEVAQHMGAHAVLRKPEAGTPFPAAEWLRMIGRLLGDDIDSPTAFLQVENSAFEE